MSNNDKLRKATRNWAINSTAALGEVRALAVAELFKGVIMDTPVDEGRLRANWQCTTDTPASGTLEIYDENGGGTVALATAVVMGSKDDQTIWLTNNLPYALAIEYGHSDKAPEGMVRKNVSRLRSVIRKAIKENKV